jgi:hypothetical protein
MKQSTMLVGMFSECEAGLGITNQILQADWNRKSSTNLPLPQRP